MRKSGGKVHIGRAHVYPLFESGQPTLLNGAAIRLSNEPIPHHRIAARLQGYSLRENRGKDGDKPNRISKKTYQRPENRD